MNALCFMGVGFGVLLGWWLKCLVSAVQDLRDARQVRVAQQLAPAGPPATPRRYTAKEILGYLDLGGRWVPPIHPVTAGAPDSVAAMAAWEGGR